MGKCRILPVLFLLLLLSSCVVPDREVTPTEEKTLFSEYSGLPSEGLLHEPYGWDSLYGSKEVPTLWWQRTPRDPTIEKETQIAISVSKELEGQDIWLAWGKNGHEMEPIPCTRRANLLVDGQERLQYLGFLPACEAGDEIAYMICAGSDFAAQRGIGPFFSRVCAWEDVKLTGWEVQGGELRICGSAGEKAVFIAVRPQGETALQVTLSDSGADAAGIVPRSLTVGGLDFSMVEDGGFTLRRQGEELVSGQSISVLTDGENVQSMRLTLNSLPDEQYYGFGMKYDSLDQRGNAVDIYTVNWYKDQGAATYTPVPYYFVPDRYGLFVDSTYYSRFEMCCVPHGETCVIQVDLGGSENFSLPFYLYTGDNAQIAASYAAAAGRAELPPVWTFCPWISANEWDKQSEIMEQLRLTTELKIPTGVVVIEAWSDEETFYTFHDSEFTPGQNLGYEDYRFAGRWPKPKAMVDALHEAGIKCLLWQIPVLKDSAYATVQSMQDQTVALEKGYVLRYPDGSPYRLPKGTWFGNSLLVDFTNPEAASWFLEKRRYLLEDIGIDGFKTDGGEFVWGQDVTAWDGKKGDELRNAYPDLYAQAYYDFSNGVTGDAITFSRAGGSAMQRHPICWVGDMDSDFPAYQDALRAMLSASMSGIPFVAWDIAGFSGDVPSTELYLRSVAQGAFSPIMQVHSESSGDPNPSQARTPWNMALRKGDDRCLETYRYYANLRMNLLPYLYTEAKYACETGQPLMRSMAYSFPGDEKAREYEFQYLLGRNLLVAPVVTPNAKQVEVYLPEGVWYDFFSGRKYESGVHRIAVEMDEIPVFVREGAIVPMNTDETGKMATYVGNGADSYNTLCYYLFSEDGAYTWFDYVNNRFVSVAAENGTVTVDGDPTGARIIRKGAAYETKDSE